MLTTITDKPLSVKWAGVEYRDDEVRSALVGLCVTANHVAKDRIVFSREEIEEGLRRAGRHLTLSRLRRRWDKAGLTLAQGIIIPIAAAAPPASPARTDHRILVAVQPRWLRQGRSGPQCLDRPVLRALLEKELQLQRIPDGPGQDWTVRAASVSDALQDDQLASQMWSTFRAKYGIKNDAGICLAGVCAALVPTEPTEEA